MGTLIGGRCHFNVAEIVIEVKRLTKNYAGLPAVDTVNFAIRAGEVLGYLGHNGAGKSTTVKMLAGLLEPTSGEILFHWAAIRLDLVSYKRRVGYVPEESHLYSFLTGWEYLDLVGTLRGVPLAVREEKPAQMRTELNLFRHRHTAIAAYSKGMRQRIRGSDGIAVHRAPGGGAANPRLGGPGLEPGIGGTDRALSDALY